MSDIPTTAQTHQETLRLILNSDTSPCLYTHEVAAIIAAISALDELDNLNERIRGREEIERQGFGWVGR